MVCGAESISNLVEEKIGKKIAHDVPNRVWVLDHFRRQFDDYFKRSFGDDDEQTYNFESSNVVCELSRYAPSDLQLAYSDGYYFKPRNSGMFRYVHCKIVQGNGSSLKEGTPCPRKSFIQFSLPFLLTLISFSFWEVDSSQVPT